MIQQTPYGSLMSDASASTKSRVILSAAELDIFTLLDGTPETSAALAKRAGFNARALSRLLDALASLGLLAKRGESYSLTESGALLSSRHTGSVRPMLLHMSRLWDTWGDLSRVVRKGLKGKRKHASRMDPGTLAAFIGAMDVIGRDLSLEIADSYDPGRYRRLLDVGGASGTYTAAFLRKNPLLRATIFDLEAVIPMARAKIASEGLSERVDLVPGDFYRDGLPTGHDLVLLSAIIHQNDPRQNIDLYRKALAALVPGGTVLIRDHIMDETRTVPSAGALFAINMLVNTRGGSTYTFEEVRSELAEAGFEDIRLLRTGDRMDCLVEGRKPGAR
ncbi:MAG: Demethylspheroidene O-methyltransferase [Syntrophorhabdus sp. PtaB.Bin047]|nr:MAG: Demethylspheroidene O-methyltransferase [Syntrophorhabdus sp. PtaB.Bin047]